MSETIDSVKDLIETALNEAAMARMMKKMRELQDDLYGYVEYQLKDDLAGNLASLVQQMANNAIDQLLAGNEDQMRRYLFCDLAGYTGREDMSRFILIHGKLNEHTPIELRRKIVDAFPDLLKNERILDLEAQVAALVVEANGAKAALAQLREDCGDRS